MTKYAPVYAEQIIKNAKCLASSCNEIGLKPEGEEWGFTQSHQVLIDVSPLGIDGIKASETLEKSNIITSRAKLPKDEGTSYNSGIRLGTSELTRLGMKEEEMNYIANFIYMILSGKKHPNEVKAMVIEMMKKYQTIRYSFDEGKPAYY